jgi:dCMP deaminase|tara:strand:- start:166 stop:606 length:441 start_codon:yes stop_codon:yes gene_type:complete
MNKYDERYLELAKHIAGWSKDPSTGVGAVAIGDKGQVLAQGYNGFPRGVQDSKERYDNKNVKYRYVVHAEMNCIYNAGYNGASLDGSTLFVYGLPVCNDCAKGIIQVGIERVVGPKNGMDVPEKWKVSVLDTQRMFKEVGIKYDFI